MVLSMRRVAALERSVEQWGQTKWWMAQPELVLRLERGVGRIARKTHRKHYPRNCPMLCTLPNGDQAQSIVQGEAGWGCMVVPCCTTRKLSSSRDHSAMKERCHCQPHTSDRLLDHKRRFVAGIQQVGRSFQATKLLKGHQEEWRWWDCNVCFH